MTVQFLISDEIIDSFEVTLNGCRLPEEREARVQAVVYWIKHKYSKSIRLLNNWDIIAIEESKFSKLPYVTNITVQKKVS